MIKCSVGKHIDTLLIYLQPIRSTELLTQMSSKLIIRIDY